MIRLHLVKLLSIELQLQKGVLDGEILFVNKTHGPYTNAAELWDNED